MRFLSTCLCWLLLTTWVGRTPGAAQEGALETGASERQLRASAEVRLVPGNDDAPDSLVVRAVLVSETRKTIQVEHGACPVRVHAFSTAEREGAPVWRSERREPWEGGEVYACPLYLAMRELEPNQALSPDEFSLVVPLSEILADSLPDGRYHFTVLLDIGSKTFEAPAGDAELTWERPPLSDRRVAGLLAYQAETLVSRTRPVVIRIEATIKSKHAAPISLRFSEDCPLVLYAYRSRERRDAAPRSGAPAWVEPRDCGEEQRELPLAPGQEVTFAIEASEQDILGTALPADRYYFAAAVQVEGRRVFLSAGEAELRR